jgi:hypothetical protein
MSYRLRGRPPAGGDVLQFSDFVCTSCRTAVGVVLSGQARAGGLAARPRLSVERKYPASAMTAKFGAIAEPLANARGSVRSHDREKP